MQAQAYASRVRSAAPRSAAPFNLSHDLQPCSYERLAQWVHLHNGSVGAIKLEPNFGLPLVPRVAERGVLTTSRLAAGAQVFAVPERLMLSTRTVELPTSPLRPVQQSAPHLLGSPPAALALLLLLELGRGAASLYEPYLRCLPTPGAAPGQESSELSSALWSDAQLAQLQQSPVRNASLELREELRAGYRLHFPALCAPVPELCPGGTPPPEWRYAWARLVVQSRAVALPSSVAPHDGGYAADNSTVYALVPVLDQLNHKRGAEARRASLALRRPRLGAART
jgi:hypothetical protein